MAEDLRFDPLVPTNWLYITNDQIRSRKGTGILDRYQWRKDLAFSDTFPELDWTGRIYPPSPFFYYFRLSLKKMIDNYSFSSIGVFPVRKSRQTGESIEYWQDRNNRRAFFEGIAKEMEFDPLLASNWRQVKTKDIIARQVCLTLADIYGNV